MSKKKQPQPEQLSEIEILVKENERLLRRVKLLEKRLKKISEENIELVQEIDEIEDKKEVLSARKESVDGCPDCGCPLTEFMMADGKILLSCSDLMNCKFRRKL